MSNHVQMTNTTTSQIVTTSFVGQPVGQPGQYLQQPNLGTQQPRSFGKQAPAGEAANEDDTAEAEAEAATRPSSGNKAFDRRMNTHAEAVAAFQVKDNGITSGIVKERECTDKGWLVLFLVTLAAMFGVIIYGFAAGDLRKMAAPYDAAGNLCGYSSQDGTKDFTEYKYLYLIDITADDMEDIMASGVCVKKCPGMEDMVPNAVGQIDWWEKGNCMENEVMKARGGACKFNPMAQIVGGQAGLGASLFGDMPAKYLTKPFGMVCYPDSSEEDMLGVFAKIETENIARLKAKLADTQAGKLFSDIGKSWKAIIILVITGTLLSFFFIWLMANCARCMAITAIIFLLLAFFGGGAACILVGISATTTDGGGMLVLGAILIILGLLFLCQMWCYRDSLETAIAIVDASADFFMATKRVILVSLMYFTIGLGLLILWTAGEMSLIGLNDFDHPVKNGSQQKQIIWNSTSQGLMGFNLFCILWILALIDDKQKYICMVSAATYYFTSNEHGNGAANVCTGFRFTYCKNLGSLCFGSFILTVIRILKFVIDQLANSANQGGDGAAKLIACLAQCLVGCLERIIEYLTKTAYAYMAISGQPFCKSAWSGFLLNLKHCASFYFALSLSSMFVIMGIFTVMSANIAISFVLVTYVTKEGDDVSSLVGPYSVFVLLSICIPVVCLGLFDEAVITTMQCYAVDKDLNGTPMFGPKSYHEKLRAIEKRREDAEKEEGGQQEKPETV